MPRIRAEMNLAKYRPVAFRKVEPLPLVGHDAQPQGHLADGGPALRAFQEGEIEPADNHTETGLRTQEQIVEGDFRIQRPKQPADDATDGAEQDPVDDIGQHADPEAAIGDGARAGGLGDPRQVVGGLAGPELGTLAMIRLPKEIGRRIAAPPDNPASVGLQIATESRARPRTFH